MCTMLLHMLLEIERDYQTVLRDLVWSSPNSVDKYFCQNLKR